MKRYAFYTNDDKHMFLREVTGPGTVVYRHENYRGHVITEAVNHANEFEPWVVNLIATMLGVPR